MLYESALLTSGFSLEDPVQFANRIHSILEAGLEVSTSETKDDENNDNCDTPPLSEHSEKAMEQID